MQARIIAALASVLLSYTFSEGALVFFDLGPSTGSAGDQFEGGATSVTLNGVTLSYSLEPAAGSTYFALSSVDSSGVFSSGETGDQRARINGTEAVIFTVTSADLLTLESLDLSGVGAAGGTDSAFVSINGGTAVELKTGAANFNGSSDVWSPSLALTSGSTLRISTNDDIGLQGMTFNATAVPEPSSLIALTVLGVCSFASRRRIGSSRK